jgi:hypothetical protein
MNTEDAYRYVLEELLGHEVDTIYDETDDDIDDDTDDGDEE